MKYVVTGGAGFIGSHLVDRLIDFGNEVHVIDNLLSGKLENVNPKAIFWNKDLITLSNSDRIFNDIFKCDGVVHCAALARTPWCISDPTLANYENVLVTQKVLEAARTNKVPRVVLSSSNVVYAAYTAYRATKEMTEMWGKVYRESYGLSVGTLCYSNVYGTRQSEDGPAPNVFAAFRKCLRENGHIKITGDGTQSRDFTHVYDVNRAQHLALHSDKQFDRLDICTGKNWTMNEIVKDMFKAPIVYLPEREGDVKHIWQNPYNAKVDLGWEYKKELPEGIKDCL